MLPPLPACQNRRYSLVNGSTVKSQILQRSRSAYNSAGDLTYDWTTNVVDVGVRMAREWIPFGGR